MTTKNAPNQEDSEAHRLPSSAWPIDDWKGRWQFFIDGEICNRAELKIDKRKQIVTHALDWADFWPSTQPRNDVNKVTWYPADSGALFGDCGEFASYVYGRHGLSISNGYGGAEGQCTRDDSEKGSLRFFFVDDANGIPNVLHVGIIASGSQVVDNNNAVYALPDRGVYLHGLDDGQFGFWINHQYDSAEERTLPGVRRILSILQELDGE